MITTLGKICWTSHFQCNRLPLRNKISPPQQKNTYVPWTGQKHIWPF